MKQAKVAAGSTRDARDLYKRYRGGELSLAELQAHCQEISHQAHSKYIKELCDGPQNSVDFNNALSFADMVGNPTPLADYVAANPLSESERQYLAAWIREQDRRQRQGRPPGKDKSNRATAKRNAIILFRMRRDDWLNQHKGRKRLSPTMADALALEVCDEARRAFGLKQALNVKEVRDKATTGK